MTKFYSPDDLVTPQEFADPHFAAINQKRFDLYIDLRVQGYSSWRVFRAIWGEEHMDGPAQARIFAMESNPYYRKQFKAKLNATKRPICGIQRRRSTNSSKWFVTPPSRTPAVCRPSRN
ncbi:hypothetical protein [Pseudomonas phage PA5]|uniref:Uncharacterized protein n=1 Tax=Pseudomonas phage PA5 TaxID=1913570 RepID=A0A1J0MI84_9CAUD|nr:hypothetical protein FDH19_gp047 [Pseudomonas phage PA5]APD20745.1 hypothetical protein [Pseudomonas phage PA5]